MPSVRVLLGVWICLAVAPLSLGQSIDGNTTISVDPSTNNVTATCETYLDPSTEGSYYASVDCNVTDDNGNVVAAGSQTDISESDNTAEVTLTFTGVPGSTYTATGNHYGTPVNQYCEDSFGDPGETFPGGGGGCEGLDDLYNFEYFSNNLETYNSDYDWYGPGPDQPDASGGPIEVGMTTATAADTACPSSVTLAAVTQEPITWDSSLRTGYGIMTQMI